MPSYKLIYFDARGRAEMTRLMFAAAGVEYEDCRLTFEEFQKLKASGKLPYGQLPVMEVDGKMLSQSISMFKFVARETGFAPTGSFEIARADMIVDGIADVMGKGAKSFFEKDEEIKKRLLKTFFEIDVTTGLKHFEKLLEGSGGKHFADNKLTYADILFYGFLEGCFYGKMKEGVPPVLDDYLLLKDLYVLVANNPGIKEWVKKRPDTPH